MHGKTVLITGGTNGIGLETARGLAQMGARVIITGRNPSKTAAAVADLRRTTQNDDIHSLLGDLSLMAETRRLAAEFSEKYDRLDVLINNAGGVYGSRQYTAEGLEYTFALNHMSYYLLTRLLLDKLKTSAPARIINVSSGAHFFSRGVNFDDLQAKKSRFFIGFLRYDETKLMNVLFSFALARRLDAANVTVHAVHPGLVNSGFGSTSVGPISLFTRISGRLIGLTTEQGAQTSIHVASSAQGGQFTGVYWDNSKVSPASKAAVNTETQEKLWRVSAEIAGLPVE